MVDFPASYVSLQECIHVLLLEWHLNLCCSRSLLWWRSRWFLPKACNSMFRLPSSWWCFKKAGIGGYLYMGNKVDGMMNENLPFGIAFQVAAGCMLTHMLISYLIKGVVMCKSVHRAFDRGYAHASGNRPRSWIGWICGVALMLLLAWFLGNIVPFFGAAVDLLGASVTPISCWFIPLVLYMRMCWDYPDWESLEGRKCGKRSTFVKYVEWTAIGLECLLAVGLMIFGTRSSLLTIVEEWATYGQPFECHCEEACGRPVAEHAEHAGMAQFCPATPCPKSCAVLSQELCSWQNGP